MISEVILQNFRNYTFRKVDFKEGVNFIHGKNGSGKTNLLEAISMLAISSGFKGAEISALNHNGKAPFSLGFNTKIGKIGILNLGNNRKITLDEEETRISQLQSLFKVLYVLPENEFIFSVSTSERRAFFDKMLSVLNKTHESHLKDLKSLCAQRIKILNEYSGKPQNTWLDAIEKQISRLFIATSVDRVLLCQEITKFMQSIKTESLKGTLEVSGYIENKVKTDSFNALEAENGLKESLEKLRDIDKITSKTLTSFEKTNFDTFFSEKKIFASNASSGEQKKMLFACILALAKKLISKNHSVIILIDEVIAKLDEAGKKSIISELQDLKTQSFLTGTEVSELHKDIFKIQL